MKVRIRASHLQGEIDIIGSKSYAHRYLIASFLSFSKTRIFHVPLSEDVKATLDCLKTLGAKIDIDGATVVLDSRHLAPTGLPLECQESGSTLRFMTPVVLLLQKETLFHCSERLMERGINDYLPIFEKQGIHYQKENSKQFLLEGKLRAGEFIVDGSKSSQYITGLLLSLPLLDGDSMIRVLPPITSRNYIDITLSVLKQYGIRYQWSGNDIHISGNQHYQSIDAEVEGDWSNAAFLDAFNYFNGKINILNLNQNSLQGDKIYQKQFESLNEGYQKIDVENCIDLAPVLFVFAAMKHGAQFLHTGRLKLKESSRAEAMKEELNKVGIQMEIKDDSVVIPEQTIVIPEGVILSSHHDHRLAMALSLLAAKREIIIEDYEAVSKSYPGYFEELKKLGAEIIYE